MDAGKLAAATVAALMMSLPLPASGGDEPAEMSEVPTIQPDEGNRKQTVSPLPSRSELVQVRWSEQQASPPIDARKALGAELPFDAHRAPLTTWDQDSLSFRPVAAGLEPSPADAVGADDVGAEIPLEAVRELQSLDAPEVAQAPVDAHASFIADLMSLERQQAAWVMIRPGVIDLSPDESAPGFVNELESLVVGATSEFPRAMPVSAHVARPADELSVPPAGVYRIPRPQPCETPGETSLTNLFSPLSAINVNTASTSPPQRPNAIDYPEELKLPVDDSCAFLDATAPAYYYPAVKFGVHRPNRNTYAFRNNPLYFEDPNLERCGQTSGCLTSLHSAAHFASRLAILPYLTSAEPPCTCVRALPDCPTCHEFGCDAEYPEWSWKGAAVEAGVITSLFYIVP